MRLLILLVFVAILYALGSAMFHLVRDEGRSDRTVRALTWRIGLSVGLFALLFLAWALGFIRPHGVLPAG